MNIEVTDDGVKELMEELQGFAMNLEEVTTTTLEDIARSLPNDIKSELAAAGKKNHTYVLRDSIAATVRNNQLNFEMVYYGYYQVFGVSGKRYSGLGLGDQIYSAFADSTYGSPNGMNNFAFGTKNNHPGIQGVSRARQQLVNLADLIVSEILQ